ncbi:Type IV fimbrial biogenesis protein PilW [hydrothermal vent metagenome]|uniref:Type IV fimbrial biogenesis protein PilW n=1 Tax=hydrothermal vent metagenome TaxID=652676 RepID=A0A3B0YPQ0_9ZZZZ
MNKQRGLSLIEIMVALTLSLILLAGVVQIMTASKQTYRVSDAASRIQENARFAMDFLMRDARMAGFWGCAQFSGINDLLDSGGAQYVDFLSNAGVTGTDGGGAAADSLTLTGAFNTGFQILPNAAGGFPVLASADLNVTPGNDLKQGDIVLVSDCSVGDIFQISNADPTNGTVVHTTGNSTQPGNENTACGGGTTHCLSKIYTGDATLYRMRRITYSIAIGGSGEPALFRNDGTTNLELVDGIENMQVLYGEDNDDDNYANYYVPAGSVAKMDNVVSIRVSLLVHSYIDNVTTTPQSLQYAGGTFNAPDRRLHQVYTTTIAIRN